MEHLDGIISHSLFHRWAHRCCHRSCHGAVSWVLSVEPDSGDSHRVAPFPCGTGICSSSWWSLPVALMGSSQLAQLKLNSAAAPSCL